MQITGLGGVSAYNPYTKINSSSQMKSVQMPSFGWGVGSMPTYTETNRTDDEIKNAMIELAKQDARKGVNGANLDKTLTSYKPSAEYQKLMGDYVQTVSPDRKAIYPATVTQLGKATKLQGNKPLIDDSLTQLILNGARINVKNAGVMYDSKSKMMEIQHFMITAGGEDIGSYSITYGWGWSPTKEEHSRNLELSGLYHDTWKAETAKMAAEN